MNIPYTSQAASFCGKNAGGSTLQQYRQLIQLAADTYECNAIHINRVGVHGGNSGTYLIDKIHPRANFMRWIANQCYIEMMASNCL